MLYDNGRRWNGSSYEGSGNNEYATISAGDVFGIKAGNGELRFFQNGNDLGVAFTGLSGSYKFANFAAGATGTGQTWNFGQDSTFHGQETAGTTTDKNGLGLFKYSDASGCIALCASNIADSVIGPNSNTQAGDNFNTVLYTGNGTGQSITGVGFQPDWVWLKTRSVGYQHSLYDSVRGGQYRLASDQTAAEVDNSSANLQSFDVDGFTVGTLINDNQNSVTYVSWNWKAGGTASSNTDGSITSQVSANTDAGFSIVSYTGNFTGSTTVGHGLSKKPELIFVKNREVARNWLVWNKDATSEKVLYLNLTSGENTSAAAFGTHTNEVFGVDASVETNENTKDMIAYCFHSVEGYSKVGSYTGNGSSDGTFIHTGFRPAWILFKRLSGGSNGWFLMDTTRDTGNVMNTFLRPSSANDEDTAANSIADYLSNGFKLRGTGGDLNTSGQTYIYLSFAEVPFKYANAR